MTPRARARVVAAGLSAVTAMVQFGMERYATTGPPIFAATGDFAGWHEVVHGGGAVERLAADIRLHTEACTDARCDAGLNTSIPRPESEYMLVTATLAGTLPDGGEARFLVVPQRADGPNWRVRHALMHEHHSFTSQTFRAGFRVDPQARTYLLGPQVAGEKVSLNLTSVTVEPATTIPRWVWASRITLGGWVLAMLLGLPSVIRSLPRIPSWMLAGAALLVTGLLLPLGQHPNWLEYGAHFGLFGGLAFAVATAWPRLPLLPLAADLAGVGAITELWQSFTPSRSASLGDAAYDALGVGAGLILATAVRRLRPPPPEA
jgi:hypothetical protein